MRVSFAGLLGPYGCVEVDATSCWHGHQQDEGIGRFVAAREALGRDVLPVQPALVSRAALSQCPGWGQGRQFCNGVTTKLAKALAFPCTSRNNHTVLRVVQYRFTR